MASVANATTARRKSGEGIMRIHLADERPWRDTGEARRTASADGRQKFNLRHYPKSRFESGLDICRSSRNVLPASGVRHLEWHIDPILMIPSTGATARNKCTLSQVSNQKARDVILRIAGEYELLADR